MKQQTKISGFIKLLIAFFAVLTIDSNAQCNFKIINTLGCAVKVDIILYSQPPAGCNTSCNTSQTSITIPSNGTYNILCTNCGVVCNIEVTVTEMDGNTITPMTADFTSAPQTLPSVGSCNPLTNGFLYDSSSRVFKISS